MQISSLNVHMHVGLQRFFNILLMMIKNLLRACNHRNSKQCGYHGNMPLYMCVVCHPDRNMLHTVKGRAQQCGHAPHRESADHTLMSAGEKYQREGAVWLYGWDTTQQTALPGSKARKTHCLSSRLSSRCISKIMELAMSTSRALRH